MTVNKYSHSFKLFGGWLAVVAGILVFVSLYVGVAGVNFDFEVFSDTTAIMAAGAGAAGSIRWSNWLFMFGNYLFLIPLIIYYHFSLEQESQAWRFLLTMCGMLYMIFGAVGSAILASAWPLLIEQYATASSAQQEMLLLEFRVVDAIAEVALHGVIQNVLGVVWFTGIGNLMRKERPIVGIFAMGIGLILAINTVGNLFNMEALNVFGLLANILFGPVWYLLAGFSLIRAAAGDKRGQRAE
ncbi:MAG: hypothetical protein AAF633_01995 [Chloroflexota bacterium]